jgi:hypothetical protein
MHDEHLHIDVRNGEIVVTLPRTRYSMTYFKPANSPKLCGKNFPARADGRSPISQAKFVARAWQAANDKARELTWTT